MTLITQQKALYVMLCECIKIIILACYNFDTYQSYNNLNTSEVLMSCSLRCTCLSLFILIQFLISPIVSTQMLILQKLQAADKQIINLAKQISQMLQSQITLKNTQYKCYTIIPSQLLKSPPQKIQNIGITVSYEPKQHQVIQVDIDQHKIIKGHYEDFDYDKILDLLHGVCAYHETREFIYQYCHKEKIRQYDTLNTYLNQAKQFFEDISMGSFNYQKKIQTSKAESDSYLNQKSKIFQLRYNQNGELNILMNRLVEQGMLTEDQVDELNMQIKNMNIMIEKQNNQAKANSQKVKAIQPEIKINVLPSASQIYDQKNILTAEHSDHPQIQFEQQKNLVRLTTPVFATNQYYTTQAYTFIIQCQYDEMISQVTQNNAKKVNSIQTSIIYNFARAVSPYELVFTDAEYECTRAKNLNTTRVAHVYGSPIYTKAVRVFHNYLYGDLEQSCTNNWAWNKDQNSQSFIPDMNDYLQPGTVLLIDVMFNKTNIIKSYHVTIQQIISPGLVLLDQDLGSKIGQKNVFNPQQKKVPLQQDVFISHCKIISKKRIDYESQTTKDLIIGKNIMKIKQNQLNIQSKSGQEKLCLCEFQKYAKESLEMEITLGDKIMQNVEKDEQTQQNLLYSYYHYYLKRTVKTIGSMHEVNNICDKFICYNFKKEQKINKIYNEAKQQLSMIQNAILTLKNPVYNIIDFGFTDQSVLMINILKSGLLRIYTTSISNVQQSYTYILTQKKILKIREFPNNTKQIIEDNTFYQNSSLTIKLLRSWLSNTIYIHKGGIWRYGDRVIFPRISFVGQQIQKIQLKNGLAHIRKLNINKLKEPNSLKISMYQSLWEQNYQVKNYPIYEEQNQQIQLQEEAILQEVQKHQKQTDYQVDFSTPRYKPLNQSISIKYQYFHGDYCGQPINKNRRTNVILKCGQAWLKINNVKEPSPCVYEVYVQTRLLCREDYKKKVQKIQNMMPNSESKLSLKRSTMCFQKKSAFDQALYMYDIATKDIYYDI